MKYILFSISLVFSVNVNSADVESTTIKRLMLDENYGDIVHIQLNQRQDSPIDCHSNISWEYVLDTGSSLGQKMYSSLLAAYASKNNVKFVGKGHCSVSPHNNTESLRRIELK